MGNKTSVIPYNPLTRYTLYFRIDAEEAYSAANMRVLRDVVPIVHDSFFWETYITKNMDAAIRDLVVGFNTVEWTSERVEDISKMKGFVNGYKMNFGHSSVAWTLEITKVTEEETQN